MSIKVFIIVLVGFKCSVAFAQKKSDTTIVLEKDSYSNFRNENYQPSKEGKYYISQDKKDTIKVLSSTYGQTISLADRYYQNKNYITAVSYYLIAFEDNNDLGKVTDRFKLACCYSMLSKPDSAFLQLNRIVRKGRYTNLEQIQNEKFLSSLHMDERWSILIEKIKNNKLELKNELDKLIEEGHQQ